MSQSASEPARPEPVPGAVRAASAIVAVEALGLVVAAVFLVVDTIVGSPHNVTRAYLGGGFAALGAVMLGFGARGLLHLSPGARSPVIVLQLLALPVGYSMAIDAGKVAWGGPLLLAAGGVLYLLFTPPARAALDREPDA